jgi:hypothetical protein
MNQYPSPPTGGPNAYQQPGPVVYPPFVPVTATTNGTAVFALVVSIGSWFLCPFVGAILGGILGLTALSEIRKRGQAGHGMAVASIVISVAHFVINGIVLVFVLLVVTGAIAAVTSTSQ